MAKNNKPWDAEVDIVVIGAGVVGLAITAELAAAYPGRSLLLAEKNTTYGQEVSSRSSEVIHAGIYYPRDSLKGLLCREGNRLLYSYCEANHVNHRRCGKVIIAVEEDEIEHLERVYRQGQCNGAELEWLTPSRLHELAPSVRAAAGIWSPNTGIIDTSALMYSLNHLARQQGATILFKAVVLGIARLDEAYLLKLPGENIKARVVINAAGLYSDQIAALAGMDIDECSYRLHYCRGEYFRLRPRQSFEHLIYPLPEKAGLGIHLTLDLNGGQRLGPDFRYVDDIDYNIDETSLETFYQAARRYLPWLEITDLSPDYCGIRPKLQAEGEDFRDFVIREESDRGWPGFINLIGIESPGLTSSLAIGRYVARLVRDIPL